MPPAPRSRASRQQKSEEADTDQEKGRQGDLPLHWLKALHDVIVPSKDSPSSDYDCSSKVLREEVLRCIGTLHQKLMKAHEDMLQSLRDKHDWKLAQAQKKMDTLRRAGSVEAERSDGKVEKMENEIASLQAMLTALSIESEQKLAAAALKERSLARKISQLDGGVAAAEQERERTIHMVGQKAIRRMQNAKMAAGFTTWKEQQQERKRMRIVAGRLLNSALARSWETWVELAEEQARARRMLANAANRLMRPALTASFVHWRRDWEAEVRFAEQGGFLRRISALEDALRHAQQELREARGETESKVRQAQEAARQERIEQMAKNAVRRMLNQLLTRGFESWLLAWEKQVHEKRLLTGFLGRLKNVGLARGFGAWHEQWLIASQDHRRLASFIGRMMNQQVARSFTLWLEVWETQVLNQQAIAKVMDRMRNRPLGLGFSAWVDAWETAVRNKQLLASFVGKLMNIGLARGFGAWVELWSDRVNEKQTLANALARLQSPKKVASFNHWRNDWMESNWTPERLQMALAQAQKAANDASTELRGTREIMQRQEEELALLRREMRALRAEAVEREDRERERRRTLSNELRAERERAQMAAANVEQLENLMMSANAPLSVKERRAMVAAMNSRIKDVMETLANQNDREVNALTQVIALRDKQLCRTSSSPRLLNKSRSLDSRPVSRGMAPLPPWTAAEQANGSQLAVTPALAEASALKQREASINDVERARLLQKALVPDKELVSFAMSIAQASPRAGPKRSWQSPFLEAKREENLQSATRHRLVSSPTSSSIFPIPTMSQQALSALSVSRPLTAGAQGMLPNSRSGSWK